MKKKWQAAPGTLFGQKQRWNPHQTEDSRIVLPELSRGNEGEVLLVMSVGPDVTGYKEGDVVAYDKAVAYAGGVFVRVRDVLGRLVPGTSPNSAQPDPPAAQAD